ncbi:guanine nucleotide exchange factor DBS isoform X2 [Eupeodes corollae]|nr:guanine nucleotide exchange factor DBS isoform X2 [Eupeodes corollae]XP_055917554.1 guanine nucleotide exchange factor DBS isoform X2 [Eupeodes corollae]XP_055917555.1 guanine nucleotide exchange factor DBS isoform X2 [Eupeodes corollae]XP_055917556.1 guanine nucleotide exchange factor DBS isoform X2 [Eupeodes corollae]XP_055917557.1 guanine nucleotide exchange factor DBS isoform X2 [Eupeodes corollae]
MDDDDAPIPFIRNRQSRKSRRYSKGRRVSIESNSSVDSLSQPTSTSSSSLQFSYSVNSQSESLAIKGRALEKMESPRDDIQRLRTQQLQSNSQSEPSLLNLQRLSLDQIQRTPVRALRQRFEELNGQEQIIFKTPTYKSTNKALSGWRQETNHSIDEAATEDELDGFSDNDGIKTESIPDIPPPIPDSSPPRSTPPLSREQSIIEVEGTNIEIINVLNESENVNEHKINEVGQPSDIPVESRNNSNSQSATYNFDFPRHYRSEPRRKTEIIAQSDYTIANKYNSFRCGSTVDGENEEAILREKCDKTIQPILDELIKTEESYVENLFMGISNYGNIFSRKDLPPGLRGKKYVLIGNIEQIAEFHRDEFLPMLQRNKDDLIRLFDEFSTFIDENCFYGYVLFTMNKKRSLKLCELHRDYFKNLQSELNDKLGINSFLVQPIQRMARYPLLLQQFITTLFKHRDFYFKSVIESCCRLEKKIRTLLTMTNESEVINDIVESNDFNVAYQGKFRKVSEFVVFDHNLKRGYRSKVFIFEKCLIYTEIKDKRLIFRGCYPCERIGIIANKKSFTLFYQKRKTQECDFTADPAQCEHWLELITEMISSFAKEERRKLKEKYSKENDHAHRRPPSLSQFRNSNRFSSDSGIGNMWSLPKPVDDMKDEDKKSTWYAV